MTTPLRGCTVCGTQDTVTVDGIRGRRCAAHVPPEGVHLLGAYDRPAAMTLVDAGNARAAFAWLRAHLARVARGRHSSSPGRPNYAELVVPHRSGHAAFVVHSVAALQLAAAGLDVELVTDDPAGVR